MSEPASGTTETDEQFAIRVTRLNDAARFCAGKVIAGADLYGEDRNTLLRAVIARLKDAINA